MTDDVKRNVWGYRVFPSCGGRNLTDEERIAVYKARWEKIYLETPWDELHPQDKRAIIKCRMPRPKTCPSCGKTTYPILISKAGEPDNLSSWYYACRSCAGGRAIKKGPGSSSAWFKERPWVELSHKGKVRRIQKDVPMPGCCPRCDTVKVQLVSVSGRWLEDVTDYIWLCRHHATMHNKLLDSAAGTAKTAIQ